LVLPKTPVKGKNGDKNCFETPISYFMITESPYNAILIGIGKNKVLFHRYEKNLC